MESVDAVVIGAGVVGLAVARALALQGRETLLVEREGAIGTGVSSRNSEVIHAGLYYAHATLKARLCVRGRELLYAYCATHGVAHRRCGKLVVATAPEQVAGLAQLAERGHANGVVDLRLIDAAEARALEPALACNAALLSPSTGIVDSHALMLALLGDFERAGGVLALRSPVRALRCSTGAGHVLEVGGDEPMHLRTRVVVNAAGLHAPALARQMRGLDAQFVPPPRFCKGSYFSLASGRAPFSRLVYPLPQGGGGLGVHLTLDLAGQARFGPDTQWLPDTMDADGLDYRVEAARADAFYAEVRRYWPALADGALQPAYSGVRPKLHGPGEAAADFGVQGPEHHGVGGLVNLFGIESPGLTSCLALADEVVARLDPT
jgi:L-2-hydroxyglutarate oxidase LhgO